MTKFILTTLLSLYMYSPCYAQADFENPATEKRSGIEVGILVDVSLHQRRVVDFEKVVATQLLNQLGGKAKEGFVIKYADQIELLQNWFLLKPEPDKAVPQIAFDIKSDERGRTLLYDALTAGIKKLASRSDSPSKVLIVIGEGNDAGSSVRYAEVKKMAQSAHVQCFALLVADHNLMGGRVRHFGFYLYNLTRTTKGAGYEIETSRKRLDKTVRKVLERIRSSQNGLASLDLGLLSLGA